MQYLSLFLFIALPFAVKSMEQPHPDIEAGTLAALPAELKTMIVEYAAQASNISDVAKQLAHLQLTDKTFSAIISDPLTKKAIIMAYEKTHPDAKHEFFTAIKTGNNVAIKAFINLKPSLANERDTDQVTPLANAALAGNDEIVKLLVENGAKIDQGTQDNRTPLMLAVFGRHPDIIDYLLKNGADVNAATKSKNITPLIVAAERGDQAIVKKLLDAGGDTRGGTIQAWARGPNAMEIRRLINEAANK